jgi:hypothetical protein
MKKNIVAKTRFKIAKTSIFVALILIELVMLSNSGRGLGWTVQASAPPSKAWSQHYGGYYTDEKA